MLLSFPFTIYIWPSHFPDAIMKAKYTVKGNNNNIVCFPNNNA